MITDYISLVFKNITKRKVRFWLNLIGIVIGIASIILLIALGQGLREAISFQAQRVGSDRIIVRPGGGEFTGITPATGEFAAAKLYKNDTEIIKEVNGIKQAIGVIIKSAQVEFKDEIIYTLIFGIPTDSESRKLIESIEFFQIMEGRELKSTDRQKAILGFNAANELFKRKISVGDIVYVGGKRFDIVGVQKKSGSPVHDAMVRIPIDQARELFNVPDEVSTIFAKTDEGFKPSDVAEEVEKELRKFRDLKEGEEDFTVQTAEQIISGFSSVLLIVQAILVGIAAISLIVGGIGIMNSMYTAVLERTREIGIMKAIGATRWNIATFFLIESGFIGLLGGIAGVALGIGGAFFIERIAAGYSFELLKVAINLKLILFGILFAFFVGIISGATPALRAAKLKPVDALRYE